MTDRPDIVERLDAFRSMVCVLVREECANEYTLNLGEMYLLIDGLAAQAAEIARLRQECIEAEAKLSRIAMLRLALGEIRQMVGYGQNSSIEDAVRVATEALR